MSYLFMSQPIVWQFVSLAFVLGYLSGSVPYGLVLGKLMGYGDIRQSGSGNIGATNALRVGGKKLAILTLFCDMLKAYLPVLVAKCYGMDYAVAAAMGAFLGHLFPVWLKFKGGKGVASGAGIVLALSPVLGGILVAIWLLVALVSKYSSLSALTAAAAAPLAAIVVTEDVQITMVTIFIAFLSFVKHRENIKRIIKGEETKIVLKK